MTPSRNRFPRRGPDDILGGIIAKYPETEKVLGKYYGDGCFSCPGQATEFVKQGALLHNIDERQLLAELNAAAGSRTTAGG